MGRGRPPLGPNGRTVQAGLKITQTEADNLSLRYGSVSLGLRALVDQALNGKTATTKAHRHVRGLEVEVSYEGGSAKRIYSCAHPGCTTRLTD